MSALPPKSRHRQPDVLRPKTFTNADIEGAAQIAKAANEGGLMLSNHVLSLKWEPNTVKVLRRAV